MTSKLTDLEWDAAKSAWEMNMADKRPSNFKARVIKALQNGYSVDDAVDAIIATERFNGKA